MALIQLRQAAIQEAMEKAQKEAEERMRKLRESIRREQAEAAAKAQEEALQASQLRHRRAQKKKKLIGMPTTTTRSCASAGHKNWPSSEDCRVVRIAE